MPLVRSRITAQGQITIPVFIRRRLGVEPGSILEWNEEDEKITVRRAGQFSSEDIHRALFPRQQPEARTLEELKEGIPRRMRERHARA